MKFTNVKQLIIKFMGGGLINFPTRFLRWVKINGDIEGSDDGGGDDSGGGGDEGGNNNVLFSPLVIQPQYYTMPEEDEENPAIYEIQNIAGTINSNYRDQKSGLVFYSKEQLINLGINENILNNLQQVTFAECLEDADSGGSKCYKDDGGETLSGIIYNNYIINWIIFTNGSIICERVTIMDRTENGIYKFGDDMYLFMYIQGVS